MESTLPKRNLLLCLSLVALGGVSLCSVLWKHWVMYRTSPPSLGFAIYFIWGPALIAGTALLIRYRSEVRRDPPLVIAAVLAFFAILAILFYWVPDIAGPLIYSDESYETPVQRFRFNNYWPPASLVLSILLWAFFYGRMRYGLTYLMQRK